MYMFSRVHGRLSSQCLRGLPLNAAGTNYPGRRDIIEGSLRESGILLLACKIIIAETGYIDILDR